MRRVIENGRDEAKMVWRVSVGSSSNQPDVLRW